MTMADWLRRYADARLRAHSVTLSDGRVTLRPLTEEDWDTLLRWHNDPEVLYFTEGEEVISRTLAEVQAIYRGVSQTAYCFMIELDGVPVGECQLQRMNLERCLERYPGKDLRRIDIMIGEARLWVDIADYNPRSRRAFEKAGFALDADYPTPAGAKAGLVSDMVIWRSAPAQK
jgi:RimJ/RimL family protein N-acetyltransferase